MKKCVFIFTVIALCMDFHGSFSAQAGDSASAKTVTEAVQRGVDFLTAQQAEDGSLGGPGSCGITALTVVGILQNGYSPEYPTVAKALKFLESMVNADGSVTDPSLGVPLYDTSLAILAFRLANTDGRYDTILKNAEKFLRGCQWNENQGLAPADLKYGGVGYGGTDKTRPDMSNTGFFMEALNSLGAGEDDPAIQKALIFVSRCQNLESPHNTLPFAAENPDGGFIYTIMDYEQMDENGVKIPLRAYGSMTYTGLKSMIYAGLTEDDQRVKAALEWLAKYYSVTENPGMEYTGLYYYYVIMSRALNVLGQDTFTDENGVEHDWRKELTDELIAVQQEDGSWVNEKRPRWMESNSNLVTAYALIALGNCR